MNWLEAIRARRSQAEVAKEAGISQAFYCEIETGKKRPSVAVAKRIAAVLGFEWVRFFE
ncbi:MAG: helix-turn-helix transcriptional regulator [Clostridiales bacterium]|nr:helix-turn-helix transcriptional regulator [Candidatus Cacconaster stercorequi]